MRRPSTGARPDDGANDVETVPVDLATWAVGPGLDVIAAATAALDAGDDVLQVGTRLRRDHAADRAAFATAAAEARRRARADGVEGADHLVLTREAVEQASHPAAAAWRAARAAWARDGTAGEVLQDRCAGTGGDAVALAVHGPVLAVERDPGRAVLARHRAAVLDRAIEVVVGDALDPTIPAAGAVVHADPDRRDGTGRRARRLADHGPSVAALLDATRDAAGHLLTVAPGVAWDDPDLPRDAEVVVLQHGDQLVEAVLCRGAARREGRRATAVLLDLDEEVARTDEVEHLPVAPPGEWLVRPAPALVRARLHDRLGATASAWRLADRRALLTADVEPIASPWWTVERIVAVVPARPNAVRDVLRAELRDRPVELVLHGIQVQPARWLREAGSPPTGPDDVRVHLVRRDDDAVAVITAR